MAILERFDLVPDLTVSCHWWRLICILRVGECCFGSCTADEMHRWTALPPCTVSQRSDLDWSHEPTPLWSRYVLDLLYGHFLLRMEGNHLVYTSRIGIHLPHRDSTLTTFIQNSKTLHPSALSDEPFNSLGKYPARKTVKHTREEESFMPVPQNPGS